MTVGNATITLVGVLYHFQKEKKGYVLSMDRQDEIQIKDGTIKI